MVTKREKNRSRDVTNGFDIFNLDRHSGSDARVFTIKYFSIHVSYDNLEKTVSQMKEATVLQICICLSVCLSIYQSSYLSIPAAPTLEHRASVKRFVSPHFLNLGQSLGLPGMGISPSQGRYLHRTTQTE
jgi:hypothetical protein